MVEYNSVKNLVCVIVYTREENIKTWLKCWNKSDTENSQLCIIHNQDDLSITSDLENLCKQVGVLYVKRQNIGMDIGAMKDVCIGIIPVPEYDYLLWFTDDVIPIRPNFIQEFLYHSQNGIGCYAITSYLNITHIRTVGFCIRRDLFNKLYFPNPLITKNHCWYFEWFGKKDNMYEQILRMGIIPTMISPVEYSPVWDTDPQHDGKLNRWKEQEINFKHKNKMPNPIPPISVIIAGRNYGRFLKEGIESVLNQTLKPIDIIYSDDYSTDDSVAIALQFKEVTVITQEQRLGVVTARNAGILKCKGDYVVHLDADDMLPRDYLEKCISSFEEDTVFVYNDAQTFGKQTNKYCAPYWGEVTLWNQNFVNTTMMIKKSILLTEMWKETPGNTMWDYDLALRLSKKGIPKRGNTHILYRKHGDSYSDRGVEKNHLETYWKVVTEIRQQNILLTVGLVYSGRLDILDQWMNSLVNDIYFLKQKPQLIIVNNSEKDISYLKKLYGCFFSEILIEKGPGKFSYTDEIDRRNKICELLAETCNTIMSLSKGDMIHFREDDVIPITGGFQKLFNFLTIGESPVKAAVAGLYLNRNPSYKRLIGGYFNSNLKQTQDLIHIPSKEPFIIDFTGTGCLLFWKELCPKEFKPYLEGIQAHDWAWGMDLKNMGRKLYIIPEVICRHYSTETEFLLPEDINTTVKDDARSKPQVQSLFKNHKHLHSSQSRKSINF